MLVERQVLGDEAQIGMKKAVHETQQLLPDEGCERSGL